MKEIWYTDGKKYPSIKRIYSNKINIFKKNVFIAIKENSFKKINLFQESYILL